MKTFLIHLIILFFINFICYANNTDYKNISKKSTLKSLTSKNPTLDNPLNELNYLNIKHADLASSFHQGKTVPRNLIETNYTNNIPVNDLQEIYEHNFCQLNDVHGVTLDTPHCQQLINYMHQQTGFNLNQKPILNNDLGITRVSFQKIQYQTKVQILDEIKTFNVSGGLMLPSNAPDFNPSHNSFPKEKIKGILVYFQGTQFDKSGVGSNINFVGTQIIAAIFASQGYIVILPDYIGMGDDYKNIHPYVLYPLINVKTAADMLNPKLTEIIKSTYKFNEQDFIKLFSVGYSEGGAYSLWFRTAIEQHPEWINSFYLPTHSVGMEGAYNTSEITADFLFNNIVKLGKNKFNIQNQSLTNLTKPLLTANCLVSYGVYAKQNFKKIFNSDFYEMNCTGLLPQKNCNVQNNHLNLMQAFKFSNFSPAQQILYSSLAKHLGFYFSPPTLPLLAITYNNTSIPLTADMNLKDKEPLKNLLKSANVNLSNLANHSVSIVSLSHDSVVSPNNFDYLLSTYPNQLNYQIKLDENQIQVISPFSYKRLICKLDPHCSPIYSAVDHPQAMLYEYLYALNIFNQY